MKQRKLMKHTHDGNTGVGLVVHSLCGLVATDAQAQNDRYICMPTSVLGCIPVSDSVGGHNAVNKELKAA